MPKQVYDYFSKKFLTSKRQRHMNQSSTEISPSAISLPNNGKSKILRVGIKAHFSWRFEKRSIWVQILGIQSVENFEFELRWNCGQNGTIDDSTYFTYSPISFMYFSIDLKKSASELEPGVDKFVITFHKPFYWW